MIIREALTQGSADLKFAGAGTPGLDASLLLAHVLKTSRTALIAAGTDTLSEKACIEYCKLIERRAGGECVAYIIEKKEFRGLDFYINKSVLVPRPDTETLVETTIDILKNIKPRRTRSNTEEEKLSKSLTPCSSVFSVVKNLNVLDLCTGSGAIAISLKHEMPELDVHAADISPEALEVAKTNASKLLPNTQIHFYLGDLYNAQLIPHSTLNIKHSSLHTKHSTLNTKFNLIVSNPPYIPSDEIQTLSAEVQNEPRLALDGGVSGLEIINRIIEKAPEYLLQNGYLLLEADPHQMDDISVLLDRKGFNDIQLYKDLSGTQRVIGGRYEK